MLYFCFIGELEEICSNLGVANLFLAVRDMLGRHYIQYSMWQFVAVVNAVVFCLWHNQNKHFVMCV